jgi:hypothetical protein
MFNHGKTLPRHKIVATARAGVIDTKSIYAVRVSQRHSNTELIKTMNQVKGRVLALWPTQDWRNRLRLASGNVCTIT